jgi:hypothetical protein
MTLPPIMHFLAHGQSSILGTQGFISGNVLSTAPLTGALMFRNCITAWQPNDAHPGWTEADKRAFFSQMVEKKMGSDGETGMYGLCQAFISLCASENGIGAGPTGYQLIGSVAGQGDRRADQIAYGTAFWQRIVDDIHYAKLKCATTSFPVSGPEKYGFSGFVFDASVNDEAQATAPSSYKATVVGIRDDLAAEVLAETGSSDPFPTVISQCASHASNGVSDPQIALALLDMGINEPRFYLSTPDYHLPHADSVHRNAWGQWRKGVHHGVVLKRVIVDGIDWKPLHVTAHRIDGAWLELDIEGAAFDTPQGDQVGLVVDRSGSVVTPLTGDGFVLRKPNGTVNDFRECKALGRTLRLRFDGTVATGSTLRYAIEGSGVGPASGPRGCIRDNQGISVAGYPVFNWMPMFQRAL